MDNGKLLFGTLYENATCWMPGAIGAYTDTRPGPATKASGEISPSLARTSMADAGTATLHVGMGEVVSVATSVRRLSFESSNTSMTVRNCVLSDFPTMKCRPFTVSGKRTEVVSNTVISASSPRDSVLRSGAVK